jgi:indolepyruvate ferredoxin oxidoreductase alpha subunit
VVFEVDESCDLCNRCLDELGCSALVREENAAGATSIRIDPGLCSGCSVCSQICPSIKPKRREQAG